MLLRNSSPTRHAKDDVSLTLGIAALLLFFIFSGYVSYWNTRIIQEGTKQVTHTHEVILGLNNLLSTLKDTETGQRGFILTGNESYLEPYQTSLINLEKTQREVEHTIEDNPAQAARFADLKPRIAIKLNEMAETIALRRSKGFEAAQAVVITDRGLKDMDIIRSQISAMQQEELDLRKRRLLEMQDAYWVAITTAILATAFGIALSVVIGYLIRKASRLRQRQEWLQSGEVGVSMAVSGEQRISQLGEAVLQFLISYFDAHAGALFVKDGEEYYRVASYGVAEDGKTPKRFTLEDGLLGQVARSGKAILVKDVPEDYLTIGSAFGQGKPRHLVIAAALADNEPNAVFELGFIHPVDEVMLELLNRITQLIGTGIKSANYRAHLQNLLDETQRQAEELQAQSEELRVNNEELEEQGRALKESQARLEQQQVEMEQTNAQLEEQTQLLEGQRDDLARAKSSVQLKAQELERASQYKSDFLANMSHELRTPLNSSLILAKLLADNPGGNLTAEQVTFAQTIQSSGNDLLSLINDILDLSKIEAGHMEMRPETTQLERLAGDLGRIFNPIASQKGLTFTTAIAANAPKSIETDRLRLEQVLKNLLANAIKFTESGSVELKIGRDTDGKIAFTVSDTGIGIAEEQQQAIFEAFRQADGTISRKYGGTGLGLSISRELTRLLGGTIRLNSEPGKGSHFTVTIPTKYDPSHVMPRSPAYVAPSPDTADTAPAPKAVTMGKKARKTIEDDREHLTGTQRAILVIEDDASFARILYELIHELGFQCLIADNAEDGLVMAMQYLPNAVLLDVGLPDNSGLSVLDRLKRDARTRHIPVHVISASDHTQTALSLGAVGYMLKPVKREELVDALEKMEMRFSHRMRRVLIVEDDPVQLDSVRRLLGSHEVETVGVGTAAECLESLKNSTFDCMVLDLSLPDASGYSLLETLSNEDAYSFPPVIVYTGRDLPADEEQRLRRYSKSIIIKGAKSPERLLDEVTLFLHQVVSELPPEQQKMLEKARSRDAVLEGRRILVAEDDIRNVYALTSIFEPLGALVQIARNGREAIELLEISKDNPDGTIDMVLMDVMMPELDGMAATREIRKRAHWKKLPIIMLTAKAMKDDQERCLDAGANDYMAKPLDVEKLLSLVRVWMPR